MRVVRAPVEEEEDALGHVVGVQPRLARPRAEQGRVCAVGHQVPPGAGARHPPAGQAVLRTDHPLRQLHVHDGVAPALRKAQQVRGLAVGGHLRRRLPEQPLPDVAQAAADGAEAVGVGHEGDAQGLGDGSEEGLGGVEHADALVVHDEAAGV